MLKPCEREASDADDGNRHVRRLCIYFNVYFRQRNPRVYKNNMHRTEYTLSLPHSACLQ